MEKVNYILFHTICLRLVIHTSTKRTIDLILFLNIQTSRYRVCQVSVPMNLNISQNRLEQALDISSRQHITFHVTEAKLISPLLLLD